MAEPCVEDDGRIRLRYELRRKVASRKSPLDPCRSSSKASDSKQDVSSTPKQPGSVAASSKAAVDQPRTPDSATEAGGGQMPRRFPSHVRVSAVRNFPNGAGSNAVNSSKNDSPETSRSSLTESAGGEKAQTEAVESQVRIYTQKRKREEEEEEEEKDKDSSVHKSVVEVSNLSQEIAAARQKVREALSLFETIYKKLLQDEESKSKQSRQILVPDMLAYKLFNEKSKVPSNGRRYVGSVPGVDVGDEFNLRVELCIAGLHRQHRLSVDFTNQGGKIVAVSLVYSRPYTDGMGSSDVFEYSSFGDLKLDGNLALKNGMDTRTPIRVIHGFKGYQSSSSRETKAKKRIVTYIYDGLFLVEKYRRKKGNDGLYVCKFQLRRMPGQPKLVMKGVKISKIKKDISWRKDKIDGKHLIAKDISQGKEKIPIPVVNTIDDEHPRPFKYITKMICPSQHSPPPPRGCDCINGCSDSELCACAVKNGGEIPFNENGAIVEAKPLVYECGPSCKCPPSCHNRVSQHGIKFQLEIFKTELRGWGVRSRDPIPSGSFICEYTGVLLDDQEADKQTNDEYLFDIGNNYYDESLWEGLKTSIPDLKKGASCEDEQASFAVDASEFGNVGRFVNHSCTPNLYAQNLLYDHDNKSMPHAVLFAAEDIPPMQELTYDYNYAIDQVRDSNGNVKKKNCYCGTDECTGWLY